MHDAILIMLSARYDDVEARALMLLHDTATPSRFLQRDETPRQHAAADAAV